MSEERDWGSNSIMEKTMYFTDSFSYFIANYRNNIRKLYWGIFFIRLDDF